MGFAPRRMRITETKSSELTTAASGATVPQKIRSFFMRSLLQSLLDRDLRAWFLAD